jgi:gamma-glutamyltranspeptidase/glutathione hydrolase
MRIAAATPSPASLEAAFAVAATGGGAVDAAVAALAVAMVNEVGVVSPGSGGFLTVLDGVETVTYDGYVAVPGLGNIAGPRPAQTEVSMAYGGGVTTIVGPGSIATPGIWAALGMAHDRHGRIGWANLLDPAISLAESGFFLRRASLTYLKHAHQLVFGHDPASSAAVNRADGTLKRDDDLVVLPDLADTLRTLAHEGAGAMHGGLLGARIAADLHGRGGRITPADMSGYRAEVRVPELLELGDWRLATNPPPAIGGAAVAGVLELLADTDRRTTDHAAAQAEIFRRRRAGGRLRSPSTVHISVVDESGGACAITASCGYGSGVIPSGTGMWMNNALGEFELVPDLEALVPGSRLVSNMAPTVGQSGDGAALAIGSPGADRITSAVSQVLSAFILDGDSLGGAVRRPRLHVELDESAGVSIEPGIEPPVGFGLVTRFDAAHMYFGGVGAALRRSDGALEAVADPRRDGAAGVSD